MLLYQGGDFMIIDATGSFCVSNICYLRKLFCLSRRGFARLAGFSEYRIRAIEEGRRVPVFSTAEVRRICAVFGITVEQLFEHDLTGKPYTQFMQDQK